MDNFKRNFVQRSSQDFNSCWKLIQEDPEIAKLVIYPKHPSEYPKEPTDEWFIVLADPYILEGLKDQSLVGLDSFYKATRYRNPVWALVYEDNFEEAVLGAAVIGCNGTGDLLYRGTIHK
jgi:hypothetical protein